MTERYRRTPPLLDAKVLQLEPLTQWWNHEDAVCVALRSVSRTPVITVGGALDRRAANPCRLGLEAALRIRPRSLLIDLGSVTSSEECCGALLSAMRRTAAWHGAEVWLAAVPAPVRQTLESCGVLIDFPVARNSVRAIEEIRRSRSNRQRVLGALGALGATSAGTPSSRTA